MCNWLHQNQIIISWSSYLRPFSESFYKICKKKHWTNSKTLICLWDSMTCASYKFTHLLFNWRVTIATIHLIWVTNVTPLLFVHRIWDHDTTIWVDWIQVAKTDLSYRAHFHFVALWSQQNTTYRYGCHAFTISATCCAIYRVLTLLKGKTYPGVFQSNFSIFQVLSVIAGSRNI